MIAEEETTFKDGVSMLLERKNIGHLLSLRDDVQKDAEHFRFHELTIYIQFARILRVLGRVGIPSNVPSNDVAFVLSVVAEALHRLNAKVSCSDTPP